MYFQLMYPITITLPKETLTFKNHILEIIKLVITGDFYYIGIIDWHT